LFMKSIRSLAIIMFLLGSSFYLYDFILQVAPGDLTNQLMHDLKIDSAGLGLVAGLYFFSYMPMQLYAGLLSDRFGPRKLLTVMVFICAIGALIFSQSNTLWTVIIGRILMGLGSAFAFTGTLVLVSRWFPAKYFASLTGILQLMSSLGAIVASTPLAIYISHYGWRSAILYLAIAGFVLAVLMGLIVRDSPTPIVKEKPIGELGRLKTICKNSQTWYIGIYAFLLWAPMIIFGELWGIPYLRSYYSISTETASIVIDMVWLGNALSCSLTGMLSEYIGRRKGVLNSMSVLGLIVSLGMIAMPHISFTAMCVLAFLLGCSASGAILTFAMVNEINEYGNIGAAIGFNNMLVVAGGALLHPLVGYILHFTWSGTVVNNTPVYSLMEYREALYIIPVLYLVGIFMTSFKIKESYGMHAKT
ncbi:MAG: MFS transporter, partial [Gammaproteobacteria bacterium]|nr:MFS transporter [Gammaproteobacteria bacterium]